MRKALLVRDNRYKENWGCRSTSIALMQLLSDRFELVGSIGKLVDINTRTPTRCSEDFVDIDYTRTVDAFLREYEFSDDLRTIYDGINSSDVVIINGEGHFIFCTPPRRDLNFTFFVIEYCHRIGKPVFVVNSMISDCPFTGSNEVMIANAVEQLTKCSGVFLRDPYSLRKAQDIGISEAVHLPDALFSWAMRYAALYEHRSVPMYRELYSNWPERQSLFEASPLPDEYVCVSGASYYPRQSVDHWDSFFTKLVNMIKARTALTVVLVMPGGDGFLESVAERTNSQVVPGRGNILLSTVLLANASAYVSGRYHPSIMASLGGTPCVFLESNSHKTRSLQEVLDYESITEYPIKDDEAVLDSVLGELLDKLEDSQTLRPKLRSKSAENANRVLGLAEQIAQRIE